jgi:hypothetical protein
MIEGPDDDVGEAVADIAEETLVVEGLMEEDLDVLEPDGIEEVPGREPELVEGIPELDVSTDLDNDVDPVKEATELWDDELREIDCCWDWDVAVELWDADELVETDCWRDWDIAELWEDFKDMFDEVKLPEDCVEVDDIVVVVVTVTVVVIEVKDGELPVDGAVDCCELPDETVEEPDLVLALDVTPVDDAGADVADPCVTELDEGTKVLEPLAVVDVVIEMLVVVVDVPDKDVVVEVWLLVPLGNEVEEDERDDWEPPVDDVEEAVLVLDPISVEELEVAVAVELISEDVELSVAVEVVDAGSVEEELTVSVIVVLVVVLVVVVVVDWTEPSAVFKNISWWPGEERRLETASWSKVPV